MKSNNIFKNKELNLIIQILNYQISPISEFKTLITNTVLKEDIDWNEFFRLVEFHKVYTHVYDVIKSFDCFPDEVIDKLKQINNRNIRKSLSITAELKSLNKLLGENNISFTVIKGQPLTQILYQNTYQRSSKDIDILVDRKDIRRTIINVFQNDYKPIKATNTKLETLMLFHHHAAFINIKTGVIVEVHWQVIKNEYLAPGFNKDILINTENIFIGNDKFNILSFDYNILYFIMHGAGHKWFRLFWLRDLAQFCNLDRFNIDEVLKIGQYYKVKDIVISSLCLCNEFFSIPSLQKLSSTNKSKRTLNLVKLYKKQIEYSKLKDSDSTYVDRIKMKYMDVKHSLLLKYSFKYSLDALRRQFISASDVELLPLPKKLFFLYYPLHWPLASIKWYKLRTKGKGQ